MVGKLLSGIVKVVATPVIVLESIGDVITGGDGSAESKRQSDFNDRTRNTRWNY
jgi:hypothetical protein